MKERNWSALAQELTELIGDTTEATAVEVRVYKDSSLELYPIKDNNGTCFYHMETVVDFCRCKKLCCYVSYMYSSACVICRIH